MGLLDLPSKLLNDVGSYLVDVKDKRAITLTCWHLREIARNSKLDFLDFKPLKLSIADVYDLFAGTARKLADWATRSSQNEAKLQEALTHKVT